MLKVIIVNNDINLSVEKGEAANTLKFTIYKDAVTIPESVEIDRDELSRVIGFVMGDDLPEPTPMPLPEPPYPFPVPDPTDPFPIPIPNL